MSIKRRLQNENCSGRGDKVQCLESESPEQSTEVPLWYILGFPHTVPQKEVDITLQQILHEHSIDDHHLLPRVQPTDMETT